MTTTSRATTTVPNDDGEHGDDDGENDDDEHGDDDGENDDDEHGEDDGEPRRWRGRRLASVHARTL